MGCAFALCLERKQQRDKECTVAMTFDAQGAFTRLGSFRAASLTERIQDPQEVKPAGKLLCLNGLFTKYSSRLLQYNRRISSVSLFISNLL